MDQPIEVSLPDGRVVDINTKEGANKLLREKSPFDLYSSCVKEIEKLRSSDSSNLSDYSHRCKKCLELYESINCIAGNADRDVYTEKVPKSEVRALLKHIIQMLKSFNREFLHITMTSCVLMVASRQPILVSMALESDFFQVFTGFVTKYPDATIFRIIIHIALSTLATEDVLDNWSVEKIFNKFEGSGFLVQILVCCLHDEENKSQGWQRLHIILEELESCPGILVRAFQNDKPCGTVLNRLLKRRSTIHPEIAIKLKAIAGLVNAMDSTQFEEELETGRCSYCRKTTNFKLRSCGRCDFIFYCSRECQKADWRVHKYSCKKLNTAALDRAYSLRMNIVNFMNQSAHAIFEHMDSMVSRGQVNLCELVVETSFMPDESGVIPALQDPPICRICALREYKFSAYLFADDWDTDLQRTWIRDVTEEVSKGKATFGTLVVYHAGRIHVDIGILEQYRQASPLDDVQMNLGTTYCCSTPVTIFQKQPSLTFGPK